ncbi:MAG: hypothetical protein A3D35_01210 [Candidatus Staskawiczbacteria bacterium RIFCSPHIGHO2_02_FULL_34_9]|uniref:Prepilin-type N-terminal cleavage/methylation domain-containing protein n=1 Tax=Candidatus Staskawiczbacteria bacterium RIFCSPHIGHO2_02_FULL_34_9 TaxID=1802206 RepID=A0A1G2I1C9_9BACT|nr:MAG: hypothetical protein A3D35_01210 [Candidatus Staskawiczbacteria bacterium RIFCSPHIGHO2_02_FULL_34_9]
MELPNILRQTKGFTLIEILIAMVVLGIIASLGLFISLDFYRTYAFNSEGNVILSVLKRVRNQSMNNINGVRHGVHFEDNSGLKYIMFECPTLTPNCTSYDPSYPQIEMDSSWGISFISPTPPLPFDVMFDQLSGDCTTCQISDITITVSYAIKKYDILINKEGGISW